MRSRVPLEVEGVVEAFAAERAKIALKVRMAFCVSIQKALQMKFLQIVEATAALYCCCLFSPHLAANSTAENTGLRGGRRSRVDVEHGGGAHRLEERIFNAIAGIHVFNLRTRRRRSRCCSRRYHVGAAAAIVARRANERQALNARRRVTNKPTAARHSRCCAMRPKRSARRRLRSSRM